MKRWPKPSVTRKPVCGRWVRTTDRLTGNLVIGSCTAIMTSRDLDPARFTPHCATINLTHDDVEKRWKALQAGEIFRVSKYLTEVYRNAMARGALECGYEIEYRANAKNKDRNVEIVGISRASFVTSTAR